ncbi:MAG: glycoside hydrolase family 43 protein [Cellvibrio sp.]
MVRNYSGWARIFIIAGVLLLQGCASNANKSTDNSKKSKAYLFAYFVKNGEDGLHYAGSMDGYHWQKLNDGKSYLTPVVGNSKLMRDPCIVRGPDGTYHMVWTSGWKENNIGYASSTDLVNWSVQKEIPVMAHEPKVRNSWAPEIVYDQNSKEFIIFWSSTVTGKFISTQGASEDDYNHRLYYTTTKDFLSFTPTQLFYDPGFSVIDATFLKSNGSLKLLVKDETLHPVKKFLLQANAQSYLGPFTDLSKPISPSGIWVEGPTAIQTGNETIIYYDAYTSKHYGALRSKDLIHWEDVTTQMSFPDEGTPLRMRHGTVIEISRAEIQRLGFTQQ